MLRRKTLLQKNIFHDLNKILIEFVFTETFANIHIFVFCVSSIKSVNKDIQENNMYNTISDKRWNAHLLMPPFVQTISSFKVYKRMFY